MSKDAGHEGPAPGMLSGDLDSPAFSTTAAPPATHRPRAIREALAHRRASETFGVRCGGLDYLATISRFTDGRLAEIFLTSTKAGSMADAAARDAAVLTSLALQHGVPIDTLRHALTRDGRGTANSPLGLALDVIAAEAAP